MKKAQLLEIKGLQTMPTQHIDPEPLFEHQGVTIYPIYRHDEVEDCRRQFSYGYSPNCSDDGVDSFDIRDIAGFQEGVAHEEFLKQAIDDGRLLALVGPELLSAGANK